VMGDSRGRTTIGNHLTTEYRFRLLDATGQPTAITGICGPSTGVFHNLVVDP